MNQSRFQEIVNNHLKENEENFQLLRSFCIYIADMEIFSKLDFFEISNVNFAFQLYDSGNLCSLPMALSIFNCQNAANLYVHLKNHILKSYKLSSNFFLEEDKTLIMCYYHYLDPDKYLIRRTKWSCLSRIHYWKKVKKYFFNT